MKTYRQLLEETVAEGIPPRFRELLDRMDETPPLSDRHTERGDRSEGGSTHGG